MLIFTFIKIKTQLPRSTTMITIFSGLTKSFCVIYNNRSTKQQKILTLSTTLNDPVICKLFNIGNKIKPANDTALENNGN